MKTISGKFHCPLCDSLISKTKYYEIIGIWEERQKLERTLKEQIQNLKVERQKLLRREKELEKQWKSRIKEVAKESFEKGKNEEKARSHRLSIMLQRKTQEIQQYTKRIKELEEQIKKGTTPQIEGFNLEEEIIKELKKEFPEDKIQHLGKGGDILHYIYHKNKCIGRLLYECKKTSKFSDSFIKQTKEAIHQRNANYGILVTTSFKKGTHGFYIKDDVLIVHPYGTIYLAKLLRNSIIELYSLKVGHTEILRRSKNLMEYINSEEFKNKINDSIYKTRILYETLKKEMKDHSKVWYERYTNYKGIHDNIGRVENIISNILKGVSLKEAISHVDFKQLPLLKKEDLKSLLS